MSRPERKGGTASLALAVLLSTTLSFAQQSGEDVILKAMRDEMERSRALRVMDLDVPYYIEYEIVDTEFFSVSATLGGLISSNRSRARLPRVQVRVGDYKLDNTNYLRSNFYSGTRYDSDQLPLDNNYAVLRQALWLATDRAYKTAIEALGRKRAALRNVAVTQEIADFAKAEPAQQVLKVQQSSIDEAPWTSRVRNLSAQFANYPKIVLSSVDFQIAQATDYFMNTEGTTVRIPDRLAFLQIRASAQAPDGMMVRDSHVLQSSEAGALLPEVELRRTVEQVAGNTTALANAPLGETYSGPILFESRAAAQLFAQLLGDNLKLPRKPVAEPGQNVPFLQSDLEGRVGSRILPEWMDVVDDPTQSEWRGKPLFGHYLVDSEGVIPKPVTLIEKGILKSFLLTRQPVKGFERSNGHARLPGAFGAKTASIGNLFIRANEKKPIADLRSRVIEMCKQRNKPYGLIIRKLDFPSSASIEEFRQIAAGITQSGGGRPISLPLLVYKLYPDGKEELVRGLRFRGVSMRSLKDIVAASDESFVFDFLDNGIPFALMGAGGYVTNCSVIAPAILFEDLELERPQDDSQKPPIVPPPPLTKSF